VWNVELTAAPPTDVVADVHELPFDDASLDGVVAEALLEHVRDPVAVVREVARVLRPGGIVCAASPFLQPYHPSPTDYHRWTLDGFRALFDGFDCVAAGNCVGPTAALHWVFREWVGVVLSFGSLWAAKGVAWLIGWVTAPLLWLDWVLLLRADSHRVASAVYFIGRKPTR
jgi:SAM-dependent methyltransferase